MIDFAGLLLDPIYDALGVCATLYASSTVTLTVLDKTEGVLLESANSPIGLATSKPAATVRLSELAANSLTRETIKGRLITFNGFTWVIKATQPKPVPSGPGELYLILQQD